MAPPCRNWGKHREYGCQARRHSPMPWKRQPRPYNSNPLLERSLGRWNAERCFARRCWMWDRHYLQRDDYAPWESRALSSELTSTNWKSSPGASGPGSQLAEATHHARRRAEWRKRSHIQKFGVDSGTAKIRWRHILYVYSQVTEQICYQSSSSIESSAGWCLTVRWATFAIENIHAGCLIRVRVHRNSGLPTYLALHYQSSLLCSAVVGPEQTDPCSRLKIPMIWALAQSFFLRTTYLIFHAGVSRMDSLFPWHNTFSAIECRLIVYPQIQPWTCILSRGPLIHVSP